MLTIRDQQLSAFRKAAEVSFVSRLVAHIRAQYASDVPLLTEEQMTARVQDGIARARSYGMTWESSIAHFVALTFACGRFFDRHPTMQKYLTDDRVSPDIRLRVAMDQISSRDWLEACEYTESPLP